MKCTGSYTEVAADCKWSSCININDNTGWRKKRMFFNLPEVSFFRVTSNQILRSKTSFIRRTQSSHSRRNCNCATRIVSTCDAEF